MSLTSGIASFERKLSAGEDVSLPLMLRRQCSQHKRRTPWWRSFEKNFVSFNARWKRFFGSTLTPGLQVKTAGPRMADRMLDLGVGQMHRTIVPRQH